MALRLTIIHVDLAESVGDLSEREKENSLIPGYTFIFYPREVVAPVTAIHNFKIQKINHGFERYFPF